MLYPQTSLDFFNEGTGIYLSIMRVSELNVNSKTQTSALDSSSTLLGTERRNDASSSLRVMVRKNK